MKGWTFFVCLILVFVSCSCARMLIASLLKGGCFFLCCLSFPKALFPHRSQGTICLFFWQEFLPIVLHPGGFQLGLLLSLFPCSSSKICPVTTLVGPWSVTVPANPSASLVPFVISHHDCNLAFFFQRQDLLISPSLGCYLILYTIDRQNVEPNLSQNCDFSFPPTSHFWIVTFQPVLRHDV